MKGIILAGGKGTRLMPSTLAASKQLLPIYNKPMIYYPLATLIEAGISEILIISTPEDLPQFQAIFGDGRHIGVHFQYKGQMRPEGIAQALILAEDFLDGESCCLILGDNLFHGERLPLFLKKASELEKGALIFGYEVLDPERYGVISFNRQGEIQEIIEKPVIPPSSYAITGIYFYDANASKLAKTLTPSKRGELEITDLNQLYLQQGQLDVQLLDRGFAWLDTGTHDAFLEASLYVRTIEKRQGQLIGCIEEAAYKQGMITQKQLQEAADRYGSSSYGKYLKRLLNRMNQSSALASVT